MSGQTVDKGDSLARHKISQNAVRCGVVCAVGVHFILNEKGENEMGRKQTDIFDALEAIIEEKKLQDIYCTEQGNARTKITQAEFNTIMMFHNITTNTRKMHELWSLMNDLGLLYEVKVNQFLSEYHIPLSKLSEVMRRHNETQITENQTEKSNRKEAASCQE